MKSKLILLFSFFCFGILQSQEVDCKLVLQEMTQLVDSQKFEQAEVKLNLLLKKCPTSDENLYLLGAKIIQNKVELATNDDKLNAAKELITLYDNHDKYFSNNKSSNLINKAMIYYEYSIANEEETFKVFDKAFTKDKFKFENPEALYTYFRLFDEDFKRSADKSAGEFIDKFNQVLEVVEKNGKLSENKKIEFENVRIGAANIINNYLNAENLTEYAEENIDINKSNVSWLKNTIDLMIDKCSEKGVFGSMATYLHSLEPSSKSAYALGAYNLKNNKREKAVEFLKLAAELATEKSEKAKIYYSNASVLFGFDKKLANENIRHAIQLDEKNGEYYIFLSNLYASAADECGKTDIEKKTIYYLANQFAYKAAEIQPMYKSTADSMSVTYKKYSFTQKESEQIKKAGSSVTIQCWINETVEF